MAEVKNNIIIQGATGTIGGQIVIKRVHGKTVLSKKPTMPTSRSKQQKLQSQRFKQAAIYAKSVLQNPELKTIYTAEAKRRGVINAYNMALSDYMKNPEITLIKTSAYTGTKVGERLCFEVKDTFKVVKVSVKIIKEETIIEEGAATCVNNQWEYLTTALNPSITNTKVVVIATDRPQNTTSQEVTIQ